MGDAGYTIHEVLHTSERAVLYRAVRREDGQAVVLKVLGAQHRPQHLERLKNEYLLARLLETPSVAKPLALDSYLGRPALVMEDFGGASLDRQLGVPMEIGKFLPLSLQITAALAEVHQRNVVHKDIKPANI